ncbi:MAG TPA: hypothetical protein VLF67_01435 [Candidatus Saccharimonas sp.]|nr:hypothetical protein [Candidatus Saccharimonas sp.]
MSSKAKILPGEKCSLCGWRQPTDTELEHMHNLAFSRGDYPDEYFHDCANRQQYGKTQYQRLREIREAKGYLAAEQAAIGQLGP